MTISYELAVELKEKGFPLEKLKDWNMEQCPFSWGHFDGGDGESYIFPQLSELIEACGDDFVKLEKELDGSFTVEGIKGGIVGESFRENQLTPEIAVARLWLSLRGE
jgi:hypothetical protein